MTTRQAHRWSYPELFTRSLRKQERRDADRATTVKTLAELRLCERLHPA